MHSLPGDGRGRDLSQHGKKPIHGGALTCCRRQRGALVRTRKETERATPTHCLEIVEGETCQDIERNRPSEAHSQLSGDGRGRDLSGRGKKTDRVTRTHFLEKVEGGTCQETEGIRPSSVHSLPGDGRKRDLSGHGKRLTQRGGLTSWRRQRHRLVRT